MDLKDLKDLKDTQGLNHLTSCKHLIKLAVGLPVRAATHLDSSSSPGQGVAVGVTVREEEEETKVRKSKLTGWGQERFLLLGQDERDAGAVRAQGRGLLATAAVEHGQRGQRRSYAAVPRHVPQLLTVALDGVVVVQLDPGYTVRVGWLHGRSPTTGLLISKVIQLLISRLGFRSNG